jgi:S1-C subfamily serine protease
MLLADLLLLGALAPSPACAQTNDDPKTQLPPELRGAKVYHLPEETKLGAPVEDLIIYRDLAYQGIDLEGLTLNLFVSIKPVDRAATVHRIYFQDVRANGIPVHVEPLAQEFKLSKKEVVDLSAPLKCAIVFPDLDSLHPVQDVVTRDTIRITGESFVEVKLNALEKLALRSKRLVLPIQLDQQVPLHLFSGNPLLQMAANKILDTLSDPASTAAVKLAKEHLEKLARDRTLEALGRASVYLLYCEYTLRDPKTGAAEKFSEIGTGFVVGVHGEILTAKRVIQPWKFDPQIAFLLSHAHLDLDQKTYKVWAWPADVRVLTADGQPDFENALSTDQQTLKVLKTAPDRAESREYRDPDSGASGRVTLQAPGENDLALLQLTGNNFHVLALADPGMELSQALAGTLLGFPFGLSQAQNNLQLVFVNATRQGSRISLDHQLNPGESGAPLLTPDGKVVGMAGESNLCTPIAAWRALIP